MKLSSFAIASMACGFTESLKIYPFTKRGQYQVIEPTFSFKKKFGNRVINVHGRDNMAISSIATYNKMRGLYSTTKSSEVEATNGVKAEEKENKLPPFPEIGKDGLYKIENKEQHL